MPTYGRPDFVAESISMFLAQDYPAKELIVFNDCPGQTLTGAFPGVRIVNAASRWATLGEKRNAAIELASGEYIAVWDDDDVYFPWRLSHSMKRICDTAAALYCPAEFWAYWGDENLHNNAAVPGWVCHPLIMFRKDLWRSVGGYPPQTLGEDAVFLSAALHHLGIEWIRDDISRFDRLMIMRCKSKYAHTSISGGLHPPDTAAGEIQVVPCPIDDAVLAKVTKRLIDRRQEEQRRCLVASQRSLAWPSIPADAQQLWLDQLVPGFQQVGYGELGSCGSLGYEGQRVEINGVPRRHALSAHAPSRLEFALEGKFHWFCCDVALNDDVPPDRTAADFLVFADGRLCGIARNVRSGQLPRQLRVDISGARELKLVIQHYQWDYCHTVWVDPLLIACDTPQENVKFNDGLLRAEITMPVELPECDLCIMTVGSSGFGDWVDDLFGSICANAQCPNALLAVYSIGDSDEIRRVAEKYNAVVIPCRALNHLNVAVKSVMYTAGRVIRARKFICLDADMLVLDDLRPLTAAIDASPPGSILVCREAKWAADLSVAVKSIYGGSDSDLKMLTASDAMLEARYALVANDGILAGSCIAFCALDDLIRGLNDPAGWLDDARVGIPWRNQCLLNLALAQANCGIELDSRYNVQLQLQAVEIRHAAAEFSVTFGGRPATIIHFNGASRGRYPELRGQYRPVTKPIIRYGNSPQSYQVFLTALRRSLGRTGRDALAWSFYGSSDGSTGIECDASELPLLAALHYLIRSNGCCRVIETGTARGISAACLASAVGDRPGAIVVTLDISAWPERETLWCELPESIQHCIEPRQEEGIAGLKLALANGETYDAALLDSVHTAEHVLQEFDCARQLVGVGGIILIHDAVWRFGTVETALEEIDRMGYGVVRLWTAETGCPEDAGLGLAVIENRQRSRL